MLKFTRHPGSVYRCHIHSLFSKQRGSRAVSGELSDPNNDLSAASLFFNVALAALLLLQRCFVVCVSVCCSLPDCCSVLYSATALLHQPVYCNSSVSVCLCEHFSLPHIMHHIYLCILSCRVYLCD